ncbi:DUF1741-domain-containing protein [Cryphonectria parasitica EP155]|uniref:DUF1741-domain-containing protein n=1 Tax=Cryphonectria parasitica (strain ATCC 38755 / EP155) TaxID=660469 RepID=A0A9P4Y2Y0_CRYP1|nr:DUF1741-domain-containing protein [Cryphonectria parasitica EP155]KAF3765997.1 DUF1741-domain-containing protein [Cryphonectria parasitica EP155]
MEKSPLTQQPRPEAFQQKVVQLYEDLFKDDQDAEHDLSEGFWRELFLLKPDRASLRRILDGLTPADLQHLEEQTRELFSRAVKTLKSSQVVAQTNALDTLSTFLSSVLAKRYTNPSSDIITILAGLDSIDAIFTDFVGSLDNIIRNGKSGEDSYSVEIRQKAVEVALAITSGAYQTSLLTYLIQKDMFPSVMKLIQDAENTSEIFEPFTLVGLLANYNKFEFQNPYQLRLNDFVNEETIQKIIRNVGQTCQRLRTQYVDIQEDLPEGWTFSNTLNMIGLGAIAPGPKPDKKPVYDADTAKKMFAELPGNDAAVLLATYDFTHANKLFCFNFVTLASEKGEEHPFASYISITSYLLTHAHLSTKTSLYAVLSLMVFRLLIEDPILCKRICSDENKVAVRLCRQRQPYLPLVRGERTLATAIIDTMIDGLNHNLKRRLDVGMYTLCVGILLRIISYMSRSRTRLPYHWSELFRSLLSLIRFLTTYAADLKDLPHIETLLDHVVNLLALGLSAGEAFLPTPAAYDDLFYKVVEAGDTLVKFRDTYRLASRPTNSIETLISVSTHYKTLLAEGGGGSKGGKGSKAGAAGVLTSLQVAEVIKQGYETLSIQAKEGLDSWERYREADERTLLKKVARVAVGDVRALVAE